MQARDGHVGDVWLVDAAMASFIVWLASQRLDTPRRCSVKNAVWEYLVWHDRRMPDTTPVPAAAEPYLQMLAGDGFSDVRLVETRAALELFHDYLRAEARTTPAV